MKREKIYFDFTESYWGLKQYIDRYNASCEHRNTRITNGARALAEDMLRLYMKQVNCQDFDGRKDSFPGLRITNEKLARLRGCTTRTVINLRQRMVESGLIKMEKRAGFQGIIIWFADEVFAANELYTSIFLNVKKRCPPCRFFQGQYENITPFSS